MDLHYSEDEQVEKLKSWWKKNGSSILTGGAIGIAIIVGYNYWQTSTRVNAETASALYEQMFIQHDQNNSQEVENMGGKLMKDFSSTPYAAKAALMLARVSIENSDAETASSRLQWVLDNAKVDADLHAARLRLAAIHLSRSQYDLALTVLDIAESGEFKTHYRELQGDIYYQQGDLKKAGPAYQEALDSLPEASDYQQVLRLKIDNTNPGKP